MVGTKMYVWGGYGGHRQRRAFYNDCYALETTPYVPPEPTGEDDEGVAIERTASSAAYEAGDLVWTKIVTGGPAPEPRSDHSTSLIGTCMLHMCCTNAVLALAQAWHESD